MGHSCCHRGPVGQGTADVRAGLADVSWEPPARGGFTRSYRFGEWISDPVTPLFESWLLSAMEERMHAVFRDALGQVMPRP